MRRTKSLAKIQPRITQPTIIKLFVSLAVSIKDMLAIIYPPSLWNVQVCSVQGDKLTYKPKVKRLCVVLCQRRPRPEATKTEYVLPGHTIWRQKVEYIQLHFLLWRASSGSSTILNKSQGKSRRVGFIYIFRSLRGGTWKTSVVVKYVP